MIHSSGVNATPDKERAFVASPDSASSSSSRHLKTSLSLTPYIMRNTNGDTMVFVRTT